ncbi:class I SAM-dependent RNA methyltransferase [Dongia sp.]|uniref:THUMP domain-containing class I SAM-dependent RNA methyltransferase n=1 Tax=Dongia sp. TaxID=1977262 RepID=UPI0035B245E6
MTKDDDFEIFLVAAPGFESILCAEAAEKAFKNPKPVTGGVTVSGGWPEAWRANLKLRGASAVFARIASFPVFHLAQLDKRARKVAWGQFLRKDVPVAVEASCKHSKIYHSGAARQRVETAIAETLGAPISDEAEVRVKVRIEDDLCTVSIDTSGESLHKRGHKEAVNKAPMRETLASLFLRQCGFDGTEPLLDPMCGSGTFVIEAAEIALGLDPGRSRPFAFEQLNSFDARAWAKMRAGAAARSAPAFRFYGCDRDAGAITMSRANAERAGVTEITSFRHCAMSAATAPNGPPGLVIVNPPYGQRMGDKKRLYPLYQTLGRTMAARFAGWRVGVITNDVSLAKACGLPFGTPFGPISHGGQRVSLYLTDRLPSS